MRTVDWLDSDRNFRIPQQQPSSGRGPPSLTFAMERMTRTPRMARSIKPGEGVPASGAFLTLPAGVWTQKATQTQTSGSYVLALSFHKGRILMSICHLPYTKYRTPYTPYHRLYPIIGILLFVPTFGPLCIVSFRGRRNAGRSEPR